MSMAAMRSTTVRPSTKRSRPSKMPRKITIAAAVMILSAKDFLQVLLEWTSDLACRQIWIDGLYVEPVHEHAVAVDVDDHGAGGERDRVRQRETTQRRSQLGLDLDNPRIDVDAPCKHVAHHV